MTGMTRLMRLALIAFLAGFAASAIAATGAIPIRLFRAGGVTNTPPELAISTPSSIATDSSDRLYVLITSTALSAATSSSGLAPPFPGTENSNRIYRFTKDGVLDQSFGTDGVLTLSALAAGVVPVGLAVDEAHEQFLLTGGIFSQDLGSLTRTPSSAITVSRVGFDGTLDTSFGSAGTVVIPRVGEEGDAIDLLPDGHLLVAGGTGEILNEVFVIRLDSDGNLDASFGNGGIVSLQPGYAPYFNSVSAITHDASGSIYLCGPADYRTPPTGDFAINDPPGVLVARLTANGAPVTSFDPAGFKMIELGAPASCVGISRIPTRLLHWPHFSPGDLIVAEVTATGALDTGFNGTGMESGPLPSPFFGDFSTFLGDATVSGFVRNDGRLVLGIAGGGLLYRPDNVPEGAGAVLTRVEGSTVLQPDAGTSGGGNGGTGGGAAGVGMLAMLALMAGLRRRARRQLRSLRKNSS